MKKGYNDLINDVLVDSELAKSIVPNKFKHTSKQGRIRRQQLLIAAKKLCETWEIKDISLAAVCEEADIPRASAYHFFPNIESIFLALRFLNYMDTYQVLEKIEVSDFDRWQEYIAEVFRQSVNLLNNDVTMKKLLYSTNSPCFDSSDYEERIDVNMIGMIVGKLTAHYNMESFKDINDKFLVAYTFVHSIFALSFKYHNQITESMAQEALTAAIAYLRCYLPEELPLK